MCYIWAKETRSLLTDEGVFLFCLVVPLGYPLLYSWIYNNEVVEDVPVAVVDQSHSHESRTFIRDLDATEGVKTAYWCNSINEAKDLIGKQAVHGIIYFPQDYAKSLNCGEQAKVSVYCDMSLMLNYKAIYQSAQAVATALNTNIQKAQSTTDFTNRDDEVTTKPLDFDEVPMFNATGGYGNAILPGVLMLIIQQTLLLGIGLSAGTARENNRFQDLVPISKHYNGIFRIVFGKAMCYFMVYCIMAAYITLCVPRFFHFTALSHGIDLAMLLVPYILSIIFFGMCFSCMVRYRENVMLLVIFTSVPLLFMSGISWPLSNMPGVWQAVAYIFPSTFGIRGFLSISSMGGDVHDIEPELIGLWIQVVVYLVATCLVYRYQINKTHEHAKERLGRIREQIALEKEKK